MVNESAEAPVPGAAFSFTDEEHYQSMRRGIVAALRSHIHNCDTYFGEVGLYDFADEAIGASVLGGRLDPQSSPLAYMANLAVWNAKRSLKSRPPVDLMGPVALDACISGRQGAGRLDSAPWAPADAQAEEESRSAALQALQDLPSSQMRTVMELRGTEGLAPRDLAERLGIPVNQVYQQWHKGLKRLRSAPAVQSRVRPAHTCRSENPAAGEVRPDDYHDRSKE
ncbi:RNA polymerase sigma factor [Streptomyces rimosus]|uniref:RNA polymerase sigma factor n=1 Tax=Streptomyces rimosus TaxID=1927 RepID=UPI003795CEA5